MGVNDDLSDALTSHAIGVQRLTNATVRKILALLGRSDARILERLLATDMSALTRARQEELLRDIREIVTSVYTDATGQLQIDLEAYAKYESEYQLDLFKTVVPVSLDYVAPAADQIVAAVNSRPFQGRLLKEWYRDLEEGAFRRLRDTIRMGVVEGRTVEQMVRDIRGSAANGYKDGILETNRRVAEATVRTSVAHTNNAARDVFYGRNARLLKGVQWSATLDGRTSAVCRARDGQVYPVDSGPRPPAHPNCRSSTIPVLKSLRELGISGIDLPVGTRASMDGQVAADTTYDSWLRRQPVEFQDDVLGKAKADLFRAGLTLDRYVSKSGDEYTLAELKRREAKLWKRTFQS